VVEGITETARTKSIALAAADWPGHLAGQHVDVRLTAEDGYQAQRSYSIASAPEDEHLMITVQRLEDGEVSPYLTETLVPGDDLELRGPGEFLGERQSGMPLLRYADLDKDGPLVREAREAAEMLLEADPQAARRHVERWLGSRQENTRA